MSLTSISIEHLDDHYLVFSVPSLRNTPYHCLQVTNYASGGYLMGYPEVPVEVFGRICCLRVKSLEDGWFALESTDEGIAKYLSVDFDGYIRAKSSIITNLEKFKMLTNASIKGENSFYLYSATGHFVMMSCEKDELGDNAYYAVAKSNMATEFSLYAVVDPID